MTPSRVTLCTDRRSDILDRFQSLCSLSLTDDGPHEAHRAKFATTATIFKLTLDARIGQVSLPLDSSPEHSRFQHIMQSFFAFVALAVLAGVRQAAAVCASGQMGTLSEFHVPEQPS